MKVRVDLKAAAFTLAPILFILVVWGLERIITQTPTHTIIPILISAVGLIWGGFVLRSHTFVYCHLAQVECKALFKSTKYSQYFGNHVGFIISSYAILLMLLVAI